MSDSFAHLHVHTEYSMLDGAARVRDTLEYAKELGMPALAQTDHGNVFGAYDFIQTANDVGIKPIVGMEAYLAPGDRAVKSQEPYRGVGEKTSYSHMTLLAESNEGLRNLFSLSSDASFTGSYMKPRADRELLSRYSTGLIGTTGCLGGEVNQLLLQGFYDEARATAGELQDIFGRDNFFFEIMDHGIQEERGIREAQMRIARDLGMPLLATNDSHFTYPSQKHMHDALLCVQTGARVTDEKRFRFEGEGYHLRTSEEMREMWRDYEGACDNTLAIAERCDVSIGHRDDLFPHFPVPEGHTEESWFVEEFNRGLVSRYGEITDEVAERRDKEIGVILQKGYPGYFLIVADVINWAKSQGIRTGPGRGSAAGALCAYALGITALCPIEHRLSFERFLNPERDSPPDIDFDIDDARRDEVVAYIKARYGEDRAAQVVTFGTMKGRVSIKDAARVLGKPINLGNKLSSLYPEPDQGRDATMASVFDPHHARYPETADLRKEIESDSDAKEVLDLARQFEGLKRQWGVHAAAVVVASMPLKDVIPLMRRDSDGATITQFEYPTCEALGLLKMDVLGLRNLRILEWAVNAVERNTGKRIDLEGLPLDDEETYRLFASGNTLGVFQVDGEDMRRLLRRMVPDRFEDISAVLALYRPGPMGVGAHISYADRKNGREPVSYLHPELEEALTPILEETYGVIVFQEQVMQIAMSVAGYSAGEADLLRRAMGKKKQSVLAEIAPEFQNRMADRGYSAGAFRALWDTLLPFADYAFNRSHTAAYGLISYWTGYLKAHHPTEYMAALLTAMSGDRDATALYLDECQRMGIEVLPPDVTRSQADYTPDGNQILFGLSAISGITERSVPELVKARETERFSTLADFMARSGLDKVKITPLALAGALDSFGHTRKGIVEGFEPIFEVERAKYREREQGIHDLSEILETPPPTGEELLGTEEFERDVLLRHELDTVDFYFSGHPLDGFMESIRAQSSHTWQEVQKLKNGTKVRLGGLLEAVAHRTSKKGNPWMSGRLRSPDGVLDMRCFDGALLAQYKDRLVSGERVLMAFKVRREEDGSVSLQVEGMGPVPVPDADFVRTGTPKQDAVAPAREPVKRAPTQSRRAPVQSSLEPVKLRVPAAMMSPEGGAKLLGVLREFPGDFPVVLVMPNGAEREVAIRVKPCGELRGKLMNMLGPSGIVV